MSQHPWGLTLLSITCPNSWRRSHQIFHFLYISLWRLICFPHHEIKCSFYSLPRFMISNLLSQTFSLSLHTHTHIIINMIQMSVFLTFEQLKENKNPGRPRLHCPFSYRSSEIHRSSVIMCLSSLFHTLVSLCGQPHPIYCSSPRSRKTTSKREQLLKSSPWSPSSTLRFSDL